MSEDGVGRPLEVAKRNDRGVYDTAATVTEVGNPDVVVKIHDSTDLTDGEIRATVESCLDELGVRQSTDL